MPEDLVNKDELYAKFKRFVSAVAKSQELQDHFEAGQETTDFKEVLDLWFSGAEQQELKADAEALAPPHEPEALGYWIW